MTELLPKIVSSFSGGLDITKTLSSNKEGRSSSTFYVHLSVKGVEDIIIEDKMRIIAEYLEDKYSIPKVDTIYGEDNRSINMHSAGNEWLNALVYANDNSVRVILVDMENFVFFIQEAQRIWAGLSEETKTLHRVVKEPRWANSKRAVLTDTNLSLYDAVWYCQLPYLQPLKEANYFVFHNCGKCSTCKEHSVAINVKL